MQVRKRVGTVAPHQVFTCPELWSLCCSLWRPNCGMSDSGDSDESPFSEGESEVS